MRPGSVHRAEPLLGVFRVVLPAPPRYVHCEIYMGLFVVSGFFFLVVFVSGTVEHLLMFIVVVYFLIYIVVISGIIEAPIEALGPRLLPGLLGAR